MALYFVATALSVKKHLLHRKFWTFFFFKAYYEDQFSVEYIVSIKKIYKEKGCAAFKTTWKDSFNDSNFPLTKWHNTNVCLYIHEGKTIGCLVRNLKLRMFQLPHFEEFFKLTKIVYIYHVQHVLDFDRFYILLTVPL